MEEMRVDLRIPDQERSREGKRSESLCWKIGMTDPASPAIRPMMEELFGHLGKTSKVRPPVFVNLGNKVSIGEGCSIMGGLKIMAAGGVVIEDHVRISLDCTIATNNHDVYDRDVLTCRPVRICENAWLGVNVTILPGVTIGKNAVIGAGSVVSRDVPANAVAAGNPARVLRMLEENYFTI